MPIFHCLPDIWIFHRYIKVHMSSIIFSTLTLQALQYLFTKSCQLYLHISLEVFLFVFCFFSFLSITSLATLIIFFGNYSSLLPELFLWIHESLRAILYTYTTTLRLIFLGLKSDCVIILLIIL